MNLRPSFLAPLASAVAALVVLVVGWAGFIAYRDDSVDSLISAGDQYVAANLVRSPIEIAPGPGYDGQFFYRMALDPLPTEATADGVTLDTPAYRGQRILYPLLAWIAGGWHAPTAPIALLAVNLVAWALIVGLGVYIAQQWRRPAWHGVLLALYPGLVLSTARDLSEVVASLFLSLGLATVLGPDDGSTPTSRPGLARGIVAGVALSLALLTRETTMVVPAGLLVLWALGRWRGRPTRSHWLSWGAPFGVFVAWQLILTAVWRDVPVLSGKGNVGVPFRGVLDFLSGPTLRTSAGLQQVFLAGVVLAIVLLAALRSLTDARNGPQVRWWLAGGLALWLCLTPLVWSELWAFMRAGTELWCIGAVSLLASAPRSATQTSNRSALLSEPVLVALPIAIVGLLIATRWALIA